jgi:hypothetical protein
MRKFILPSILLTNCLVTVAQNKQTFLVEYISEQKTISNSLPDSVKGRKIPVTIYTINNGDTTNTDTIETNIGNFVGSSGFAVTFYILSGKDMSKTFYTLENTSNSQSGGNISFTVNIPVDTIFYDRKKWYQMSEGSIKEVDPADMYDGNVSFIKTSETKEILGYKCYKFVVSGKDKEKNISFWGCKDLPATLIPYAGFKNVGYGILQVDNPKLGLVTKATKITKF